MGHKCILTLAALALLVHCARAMQGQEQESRRRARSQSSSGRTVNRQSSLTSSRGGEPAEGDMATNMNRVADAVINDPCRRYQNERSMSRASSRGSQGSESSEGTRGRSTSLSPSKSRAIRACASAVNAYIALDAAYKIQCPTAYAADCVRIDGDLTCTVIYTKTKWGCFPSKGHLSLGKCAREVMSYQQLNTAARNTQYGRSTSNFSTGSGRGGGGGGGAPAAGSGQLGGGGGRRSASGSGEIRPAASSGQQFIGRGPEDRSGTSRPPGAPRSFSTS